MREKVKWFLSRIEHEISSPEVPDEWSELLKNPDDADHLLHG